MEVSRDLRKIISAVSSKVALYAIAALAFVAIYTYVDYKIYLSSYQITQQSELVAIQNKFHSNIENLKKLSVLTSNRILSYSKDLKQIQNILNSSYSLLPHADQLKIERITYDKLSSPQSRVTRFGALSLKSEDTPSETPNPNGPVVLFNKASITCKNWIFDVGKNHEGFLTISLNPAAFNATLPIGDTISFMSGAAHILLQHKPFPIYGKLPANFWGHSTKHKNHYAVFFLFILFSLVFMTSTAYWLWLHIRKTYSAKLQKLKNLLSLTQTNLEKIKTAFFVLQQHMQNHQTSYQAYKKFQASFRSHQREQVHHLLRSLDVILDVHKRHNTEISSKELIEIIESCVKAAERLSEGVASKIRTEPIKILTILDNLQDLFAEKIYKSSVELDITCSENLFYQGDAFFIEYVLIHVIGKALYGVSHQGKVNIKATNQREGCHIHIRDNGFFPDNKLQRQLNQAFDLFMSQENFRKLCQEHKILFEYHRTKNGFNNTKILFPKIEGVFLGDNIIPFFRKT